MSACGKLHAATLELAKGTPLKHRLAVAFSKHLREVDPTELPAALQEQFIAIRDGLESVRPLPGESAVQATVRKLSAEQADLYAARIVDLFHEVARTTSAITLPRAPEAAPLNGYRERADNLHVVPLLYAAEA
jgi:hypothetical protein